VTAGPKQDQLAAATQAKGEAAEVRHQAEAQAQHQASGSTVVVEQAATPDDVSVVWSTADTTAQPTLVPSEPPPVGQYRGDPPAA
jgi:hypothetical protein